MLVVGLGRVNPGTVLWEVLVAVHGMVGHHLDCGWSSVVAPRDAVLWERGRLRSVNVSILDRRILRVVKRAGGGGASSRRAARLAMDGRVWMVH
jgi:hypothetical protein